MAIKYELQITNSLATQIAESIRDAILAGRLKVDERLPTEGELAQKFGVSRPTIREALKRLAAQNLIRSRRGPSGGSFVKRPSEEESRSSLANTMALLVGMGAFSLDEITEARHKLESVCCRLAAESRQEPQLAAMAVELEIQKGRDITDVEFCASDVRFHRALVEATQNPVLQFVMGSVIEALQPIANMVVYRFRERKRIVSQHERLYEAIQAQDSDAAETVFTEQMSYLREKYTEAQEWRRRRDET